MGPAVRKINPEDLAIVSFNVTQNDLVATISDGRTISIPKHWFGKISAATSEQLKTFQLSPGGYGVHFPDLDEDISINAFLNP